MPSPIDHDAEAGVAAAVTDAPGTEAVADRAPQPPRSSHNQVGRFTSLVPAGLDTIRGTGNRNCDRACCASSSGDGSGAAPGAWPSGIHTGARYNASRTP
ncbi:hypothetical protein [Amycolatopsis sp. NBC_01480]|uniref:hypothetical protein n=1 Tax=Amycolatopsis sp. NBC_01480 TaxID=2903562 RepID=UPI002E2DA231|nr:hypothetical protein [Amycolatopsis sp. NBC_01480]